MYQEESVLPLLNEELDKSRIRLNFKERILERKEVILNEMETELLEEKKRLLMMKQQLQSDRDAFEKEKRSYEIKISILDDYFQIPVENVVATVVANRVSPTILEYIDL
jgi:hypothetical protein